MMAQVSDVLVSVSTDSMLNETCTAARSMRSSDDGSIAASVKMYASIVAMFGSIMPDPFATHVIMASPTFAEMAFGYVSVVMIPAAPTSGSIVSSLDMPWIARSIRSIGSLTPITPVELTSTRSALVPTSAAAALNRLASENDRSAGKLVPREQRRRVGVDLADEQGEVFGRRLEAAVSAGTPKTAGELRSVVKANAERRWHVGEGQWSG